MPSPRSASGKQAKNQHLGSHKVATQLADLFEHSYPQWEYWNFFTRPDAANLMRLNIRRFYEVMHGNYPSPEPSENSRDIWMREMFCTPNAMYEYITSSGKYADYTVPLKPYAQSEELWKRFEERMCRDGLEGPVNYYHSLKENVMLEDEKGICEEGKRAIDVPVLYIGQTGDWVCRTDLVGSLCSFDVLFEVTRTWKADCCLARCPTPKRSVWWVMSKRKSSKQVTGSSMRSPRRWLA